MALYNNTSTANNANSAPITDSSSLLAGSIGAGVGLLGTYGATNALTGAEQNAIGTQQGAYGASQGIYGNQASLGNAADTSLGAQLGINGQAPNYSAFNNSPGYQFAQAQGDQAIARGASANGSLYTPNTLAMLSQYNTGYASQNYNNYISQLMSSAGLGNSANQGLNSANLQTSGNVSQLQQNQGNAAAGGIANASGIVSNLIGRSGSLIGGSSDPNTSGIASSDSSYLSNNANYNIPPGLLASQGDTSNLLNNNSGGTTTYFGDDSNP